MLLYTYNFSVIFCYLGCIPRVSIFLLLYVSRPMPNIKKKYDSERLYEHHLASALNVVRIKSILIAIG